MALLPLFFEGKLLIVEESGPPEYSMTPIPLSCTVFFDQGFRIYQEGTSHSVILCLVQTDMQRST